MFHVSARSTVKHICKIAIVAILLVAVVAVVDFLFLRGDTSDPEEQLLRMSREEREYCEKVLGQITSSSTEADVEALLGKPSRDLKWKKNWWVTLGDHKARVGVYFSADGHAHEIVLDGDRYYYRRKVPPARGNTT